MYCQGRKREGGVPDVFGDEGPPEVLYVGVWAFGVGLCVVGLEVPA